MRSRGIACCVQQTGSSKRAMSSRSYSAEHESANAEGGKAWTIRPAEASGRTADKELTEPKKWLLGGEAVRRAPHDLKLGSGAFSLTAGRVNLRASKLLPKRCHPVPQAGHSHARPPGLVC